MNILTILQINPFALNKIDKNDFLLQNVSSKLNPWSQTSFTFLIPLLLNLYSILMFFIGSLV